MGEILSIWLKRAHHGPMDRVDSGALPGADFAAMRIRVGGVRSRSSTKRHGATLRREVAADVDPSARRANVLLRGLDLENSRGRLLRLGECVIRNFGEMRPCELMDEAQPGLRRALATRWRGGTFGEIVTGGTIRVGDPASWSDAARPDP